MRTGVSFYCGDNLGKVVDIRQEQEALLHEALYIDVHKVLKHKMILFKVFKQLFSATRTSAPLAPSV